MKLNSKLLTIVLIISLLLNVVLGGYLLYFRNYILSEEFSVISIQQISTTFCRMYEREFKNKEEYQKDTFYKPYCEKVLELEK